MRCVTLPQALLLSALPLISTAAIAQPISGLYAGANVGGAFLESQRVLSQKFGTTTTPLIPSGNSNFQTGYVGMLNLGYGLGNGLRFEVEGTYQNNDRAQSGDTSAQLKEKGNEKKYGLMGNAIFDFDIGSPYVYPYLGVGIGYQNIQRHETQTFSSGVGTVDSGKGAFAYQAMAGLSLPIPAVEGLSATVEYRFVGLSGERQYNGAQTTSSGTSVYGFKATDNSNHMALVGLRYVFDEVPPPAPVVFHPAPAPAAAPAPQPARSYMVFFDWDKSDLTARAQLIVAEAARNATRGSVSRIAVSGHADKSGVATYNQALSLARANVVATELVRLGVPKTAILISAFGDTKPLVPTTDGVREPQNRRVEIVLR